MDLVTFERETAVHRAAYDRLRDQIRREHAGQYVVLAHGRLVAASDSFDDAVNSVQRLQPVPEYFLVFPADDEPDFEPYDI